MPAGQIAVRMELERVRRYTRALGRQLPTAAPGCGDPHQVDADAWAILRADSAAKRLCDLHVRLQLVLALGECV